MPSGATSGPVLDVDGDGRRDTGWIVNSGSDTLVGITTASGARMRADFTTASPLPRSMLVADVDGRGTVAVLLDDGRGTTLHRVLGCRIVPVLNREGHTYAFDRGYGDKGTGVGCSQVAGTSGRSLVGLLLVRDANGNPRSVERTQIVINGAQARNGARDSVPATDPNSAAVRSATDVTCGDLTLEGNGISTPD